ncbi:hypothetical protein FSW04_04630 [Baekduia soli]|uniref:Uncharacterized protein n=1 Tax=Baekduia soli TaxID=496014 RepID=A0A5B8U1S4_9ACTN|nr:hypothetical protein [Baekduia soli]QEC46946.1 hypothetical protein FSW04_04630 [Baekduia soli]
MPERDAIAMWGARLRWRLRGAWQWPVFVVATVVDAVVLARLPFAGGRSDLLGSVLAAGFMNLIVIAVVSRAGGALLRRRRPQLPREIAADHAGTAGLAGLAVLLVVGGLLHRPALTAGDATRAEAVAAARAYAAHHAPAEYAGNLGRSDTWTQASYLYRTCFPGADPRRDWCVIVRTDEPSPVVRRDPDQRPNATIAGPDNPGRAGA